MRILEDVTSKINIRTEVPKLFQFVEPHTPLYLALNKIPEYSYLLHFFFFNLGHYLFKNNLKIQASMTPSPHMLRPFGVKRSQVEITIFISLYIRL